MASKTKDARIAAALLSILPFAENEVRNLDAVEKRDGEDCGARKAKETLNEAYAAVRQYYMPDNTASWMVAARHKDPEGAIRLARIHCNLTQEQASVLVGLYTHDRR